MVPFRTSPAVYLRRFGALTAFVATAVSVFLAAPARCEIVDAGDDYQIYVWPKVQKGIVLGGKFLGRFGAGTNINTPPGDIYVQGTYHIWSNHVIEFHADLGLGLTNGGMIYGLGVRLNLIEFIEDPTKEMMVRGLQRGMLSKSIKNFMLFMGLDFDHFGFREPDPSLGLSYETGAWKIIPSLGAQWYFYFNQNFAGRFYVETSVGYATFGGSKFFIPYLGFGAELM